MTTRRAFTLIELLIVVAIIAILAAIAVPNFLQAQTRAKVSAAKANLKVAGDAIMMYHVDHNAWPPTEPQFPEDPLALLADQQLWRLTSPIAYLTGAGSFRDPFGVARLYTLFSAPSNESIFAPNANQALLYHNYQSTAARLTSGQLRAEGFGIISIGPDLEDSLGAFCRLPRNEFMSLFVYSGVQNPVNTIYDPTNGTASKGDIVRFNTGEFAGR